MGNVYSQNAVAKYLENSSILKARLKVVFNFLLTARPWAERGSCSARGFLTARPWAERGSCSARGLFFLFFFFVMSES